MEQIWNHWEREEGSRGFYHFPGLMKKHKGNSPSFILLRGTSLPPVPSAAMMAAMVRLRDHQGEKTKIQRKQKFTGKKEWIRFLPLL